MSSYNSRCICSNNNNGPRSTPQCTKRDEDAISKCYDNHFNNPAEDNILPHAPRPKHRKTSENTEASTSDLLQNKNLASNEPESTLNHDTKSKNIDIDFKKSKGMSAVLDLEFREREPPSLTISNTSTQADEVSSREGESNPSLRSTSHKTVISYPHDLWWWHPSGTQTDIDVTYDFLEPMSINKGGETPPLLSFQDERNQLNDNTPNGFSRSVDYRDGGRGGRPGIIADTASQADLDRQWYNPENEWMFPTTQTETDADYLSSNDVPPSLLDASTRGNYNTRYGPITNDEWIESPRIDQTLVNPYGWQPNTSYQADDHWNNRVTQPNQTELEQFPYSSPIYSTGIPAPLTSNQYYQVKSTFPHEDVPMSDRYPQRNNAFNLPPPMSPSYSTDAAHQRNNDDMEFGGPVNLWSYAPSSPIRHGSMGPLLNGMPMLDTNKRQFTNTNRQFQDESTMYDYVDAHRYSTNTDSGNDDGIDYPDSSTLNDDNFTPEDSLVGWKPKNLNDTNVPATTAFGSFPQNNETVHQSGRNRNNGVSNDFSLTMEDNLIGSISEGTLTDSDLSWQDTYNQPAEKTHSYLNPRDNLKNDVDGRNINKYFQQNQGFDENGKPLGVTNSSQQTENFPASNTNERNKNDGTSYLTGNDAASDRDPESNNAFNTPPRMPSPYYSDPEQDRFKNDWKQQNPTEFGKPAPSAPASYGRGPLIDIEDDDTPMRDTNKHQVTGSSRQFQDESTMYDFVEARRYSTNTDSGNDDGIDYPDSTLNGDDFTTEDSLVGTWKPKNLNDENVPAATAFGSFPQNNKTVHQSGRNNGLSNDFSLTMEDLKNVPETTGNDSFPQNNQAYSESDTNDRNDFSSTVEDNLIGMEGAGPNLYGHYPNNQTSENRDRYYLNAGNNLKYDTVKNSISQPFQENQAFDENGEPSDVANSSQAPPSYLTGNPAEHQNGPSPRIFDPMGIPVYQPTRLNQITDKSEEKSREPTLIDFESDSGDFTQPSDSVDNKEHDGEHGEEQSIITQPMETQPVEVVSDPLFSGETEPDEGAPLSTGEYPMQNDGSPPSDIPVQPSETVSSQLSNQRIAHTQTADDLTVPPPHPIKSNDVPQNFINNNPSLLKISVLPPWAEEFRATRCRKLFNSPTNLSYSSYQSFSHLSRCCAVNLLNDRMLAASNYDRPYRNPAVSQYNDNNIASQGNGIDPTANSSNKSHNASNESEPGCCQWCPCCACCCRYYSWFIWTLLLIVIALLVYLVWWKECGVTVLPLAKINSVANLKKPMLLFLSTLGYFLYYILVSCCYVCCKTCTLPEDPKSLCSCKEIKFIIHIIYGAILIIFLNVEIESWKTNNAKAEKHPVFVCLQYCFCFSIVLFSFGVIVFLVYSLERRTIRKRISQAPAAAPQLS